jgi:methyl-accepting chemotaxis protein
MSKTRIGGGVLVVAALAVASCTGNAAPLQEQYEVTNLVNEMRTEFAKAAEAGHRAVMAESDADSIAAAKDADTSTTLVADHLAKLRSRLKSVGDSADLARLDVFTRAFEQYRALDREILSLAVENTNLKAQRLVFGDARQDLDVFRRALDAAGRSVPAASRCGLDVDAEAATAALLETETIEARHIAEADESAMSKMETQMADLEQTARRRVDSIKARLPAAAAAHLTEAAGALERFAATRAEIVALSRRNSNVRSLALSLGKQRTATAACTDALDALAEQLATHSFKATR